MASKNYKINIAGKTYDVEVGDISKSPVQVLSLIHISEPTRPY